MPIYLCLTDTFSQNFIYSYLADIWKWIYLPNIGNSFNSLLLVFFLWWWNFACDDNNNKPNPKKENWNILSEMPFHTKKIAKRIRQFGFWRKLSLSNLPPELCYDFATSLSGENCGQFSKQMSSINTKATLGYSSPRPTPTSHNWKK